MEGSKMPKMQNYRKEFEARRQVARIVKRRIALVIALLIAILLILIFRVGVVWWPVWVIEYRTQIAGIISLVTICLILLSPLMTEAHSNPRSLSGPGEGGW